LWMRRNVDAVYRGVIAVFVLEEVYTVKVFL
jgi:hypothetical protein